MARKPRIHIPGALYHVILRGNGGQDIFFEAEDRNHFYFLLQQGINRYGHRIHGFCCMTNHVHLIIQVGEESLSKIMQNVSFRYTRWINKRQKRIGHLFQGRYKAILVDGDSYLLELVRYVHLNPIRAGLVENIDKYQWSSHKAYMGRITLPWLTTDYIYSYFGKAMTACMRKYESFIIEGMGEGYRKEFYGGDDGRLLGGDEFIEKTLAKMDERPIVSITLSEIIHTVCTECGIREEVLYQPGKKRNVAEARGIIAWLSKKFQCETLTAVASRFNRDVSTMSSSAARIETKRCEDGEFGKRLNLIESSILQA